MYRNHDYILPNSILKHQVNRQFYQWVILNNVFSVISLTFSYQAYKYPVNRRIVI